MSSIRDTVPGRILDHLHTDFAQALKVLVISLGLTYLTYLLGYSLGWIEAGSVTPWEFFGTAFNYACVYLAVYEKNWQWPLGIAAVVFLGVLFWQSNLLASFALTVGYFLPIQFLGWYRWMYGQKTVNFNGSVGRFPLKVTKLSSRWQWALTAIGMFVAWAIVHYVDVYFGGALSGWDSAIFVLSFVAQWLLNEKKIECWILWILVNILSVYTYGTTGLFVLAVQYSIFLLNAFNGLREWGWSKWHSQVED